MGADNHLEPNGDDTLSLNGHRIWPSYDLHCPTKRPLYHVNRSTSGNRRYPMVKISLPSKMTDKVAESSSVVKLDDIYNFVERKRVSSSGTNRRQTVEMGRNNVQSQLGMSRPHSCSSQFNKNARPSLPRRATMDTISLSSPIDQQTFRPVSVATSSASHILQHQCCELMGPTVCNSCSKQNAILINRAQTQSAFANYKMTTENVATATMVKRILPYLSTADIQHKLNTGGISYLTSVNCKNADKYEDSDDEETSEKGLDEPVKIPLLSLSKLRWCFKKKTTTPMFFNSIRQLNQKIVSGSVNKDIGRFCPLKEEVKRTESPIPVFVSPKKNSRQEPSYKAYFEPPLLEKENQTDPFAPQGLADPQNDAMLRQQPKRLDSDSEDDCLHDFLSTSRLEEGPTKSTAKKPFDPPLLPKENQIEEPSFFAGSVIPYTLPARAPDKLGSFDINRMNGELTSSESDNEN